MNFAWQWSTVLDKRTCETCFRNDGRVESTPGGFGARPPVHPRCRCVLVLIWQRLGGHRSAGGIAPDALLEAEASTRAGVRRALPLGIAGPARMRVGLAVALGAGRKNARTLGRTALAAEVGKLRPKLDASALLGAKHDRRDAGAARRDARALSAWWLVAVAAVMRQRHVDRERAKELATIALRKRAEGAIITSTAEAFNDERAKAAPEVRRLKEKR